jgi:hypothetical protein
VAGQSRTLKNFHSYSFDSFDGSSDHFGAKNWLNERKVMYTTYKLSREVKRWLQAKKVLLVVELGLEQAITGDIFNEEFNNHFFPRVVQETKPRKF